MGSWRLAQLAAPEHPPTKQRDWRRAWRTASPGLPPGPRVVVADGQLMGRVVGLSRTPHLPERWAAGACRPGYPPFSLRSSPFSRAGSARHGSCSPTRLREAARSALRKAPLAGASGSDEDGWRPRWKLPFWRAASCATSFMSRYARSSSTPSAAHVLAASVRTRGDSFAVRPFPGRIVPIRRWPSRFLGTAILFRLSF